MTATPDQLPRFPMPRPSPLELPEDYRRIREAGGMGRVRLYDGRIAWLVTRHDHVRALLADPRISADVTNDNFPFSSPARAAVGRDGLTFIAMDGPEHLRLRRVFTGYFSIKRVEALRPVVEQTVDAVVDDLLSASPPRDLVREFALEVPARVICAVLGIPERDRQYVQRLDSVRNTLSTPAHEVAAATAGMLELVERLISDKQRSADSSLISALVHEKLATGAISRDELVPAIRLLITAGHETTANMIALSVVTLLQNREQLAQLVADPGLMPRAVEELLRYVSVFHISPTRVATEAIELDGVSIAAGDGVIAVAAGANHDGAAFADPDRFDIHRDARRHMAFGYGVHQCLGQPLARVELQVALGTLIRRVPSLRLAVPPESLALQDYAFLRLAELPVTWDAA